MIEIKYDGKREDLAKDIEKKKTAQGTFNLYKGDIQNVNLYIINSMEIYIKYKCSMH